MSFRFRLYLADGEDLDDYVAARPDWRPGDTVLRRRAPEVSNQRRDPGEQPRQRGLRGDLGGRADRVD